MSANRPFTSIPRYPPEGYSTASRERRDNKLQSSVTTADSLVAFYQQEQMWIYKTRASLVNNFQSPPPMDRDARDMADQYNHPAGQPQHTKTSRWMRRKQDFKLRINDIPSKYYNIQQKSQATVANGGHSPEKILDMFDKLVEMRMESCERVGKLARQANLAHSQHTAER